MPSRAEEPLRLGVDAGLWPVVRQRDVGLDQCRFDVDVPEHLSCWPGHFPGWRVVPGTLQLYWVLVLVAHYLALPPASVRIERVKFAAPIEPGQRLSLSLERKPGLRVAFRFHDMDHSFSSGLLAFAGEGQLEVEG